MTIHRATAKDMPLIAKRLAELPRVPPVHWSQGSDGRVELPDFMTAPDQFVYVDTDLGQVCRVSLVSELREATVVYLLPRAAWTEDNMDTLQPLLLYTLEEVLAARPETKDWVLWGEFMDAPLGGMDICNAWRDRFVPGASVDYSMGRDIHRISWTLGKTIEAMKR